MKYRSNIFYSLILIMFIQDLAGSSYDNVEELTGENFDKKLTSVPDQYSLVMFYAPWCSHCKDTKPHFSKAAARISEKPEQKNKKFFLVNCEEKGNQEICSKEMIEGFPTLKLYENGKLVEEYFDENLEESFVKYMMQPPKLGEGRPASGSNSPDIPLENVLNVNAQNFSMIKDYKEALIFFYAPWCPHCTETKPKFSKAGKKYFDEKSKKLRIFAAMNCDKKENEDLCTEEKVDGFPTIRYYKNGEAWAEYEEDMSYEAFSEYFDTKAPATKQKILTIRERFPVENKDENKDKSEKSDEINWESVEKLATDKDYQTTVKSPTNGLASLVMFYTPWCPHCVKYKPYFIEGSKAVKGSKDLKDIVSMYAVDCDAKSTESSCTAENITGYPSIFLFDKNGKKIHEMSSGLKSSEEINDFLESNLMLEIKASSSKKNEESSFAKDEL